MNKSAKPRFTAPADAKHEKHGEPEHPAIAYMNGFMEPLLKAEPHLWQLLEATRMSMTPQQKRESYLDSKIAVRVIVDRPRLFNAFGQHPDVIGLSHPPVGVQDERMYALSHNVTMAKRIMQLGAFRSTKYIVQPHPGLEQELFSTDLPDEIPVQALLKTPSWGMYLELGNEFKAGTVLEPFHGIFVGILSEAGAPVLEMTAVGHGYAANTASVSLGLSGNVRISDSLKNMQKHALNRVVDEKSLPAQIMKYAINMMLYMSSKEPDYDRDLVKYPTPKPSLRGFYFPEPKTLTEVSVGVRLGSALVQAKRHIAEQSAGTGRGAGRVMPPHVRKAHYHAYLVGPRKIEGTEEEKKALLAKQDYIWHWLPSIPVNVKDFDKLQAVRRVVESVDENGSKPASRQAAKI